MAQNIVELNIDGTTYTNRPFGWCTTTGDVGEKVVACPDFVLVNHATILVMFLNTNTVSAPTLNVNGTSPMPISCSTGSSYIGDNIKAGGIYEFMLVGSNWQLLGEFNTTYSAATTDKLGLIRVTNVNTGLQTVSTNGTVAYGLEIDGFDKGFVKIPQIPQMPIWGEGLTYDSETNILTGSPQYTLPKASASVLGGVKVGTNLSIDTDGVLSATDTTYSAATATNLGLIKTGSVNASQITKATEGENYYPVNIDSDGLGYVALPSFTATDTTYSAATTDNLGLIKVHKTRTASVVVDVSGGTTSISRKGIGYCGVELDGNGKAFVYVPTASGTATTTTLGLIGLGYTNTTQEKKYPVELESNKAFVSVPWTDENVKVTTATTTKSYLLGVPSEGYSSGTAVNTIKCDTGVYLDTTAGYLTATRMNASGGFYETSDERLKDFSVDIDCDLDRLSKLPKKYFRWKDSDDKNLHIGTSAQVVQEIYPELVSEDENGILSVAYDKLSVVALKGIDILNDKIKSLEERLERLEKIIKD